MPAFKATARQLLSGTRPPSDAEAEFLRRYFGGSLDLSAIRVAKSLNPFASWSPFGSRISLQPHCLKRCEPRETIGETDLANPIAASTFAHEALHVWQRQHGRPVSLPALRAHARHLVGGPDPYGFPFSEDPAVMLATFRDATVEQQGAIFQEYVRRNETDRPTRPFESVARLVRGASA